MEKGGSPQSLMNLPPRTVCESIKQLERISASYCAIFFTELESVASFPKGESSF